jgi:two-component system sensor histidine kinase BaeS
VTPRRLGLGAQVALLAGVVAATTGLVGGLVAVALIRSPAESQARAALHRESQLIARFVDSRSGLLTAPRAVGALRVLQAEGVTLVRVDANGALDRPTAMVTAADVRVLLAGSPVRAVRRNAGHRVFVDGQPLSTGGAVVLTQPAGVAKAVTAPVRKRIVVALAAAVALAVLAGVLLARRVTRPLRRVATSAHALATGARGVPAVAGGSSEVEEVSAALTRLDQALTGSEDRQRRFLLSVSHELRTPLTSLRGFAESLADGVVSAEEAPQVGATLVEEADRLDRLVRDLLDLARLGADSFRVVPADVDLSQLIDGTATVWHKRCSTVGVDFELEGTGPVRIRTDPQRLRQVLDNLLENALRVTPAGGRIVLSARLRPGHAELVVADTGPGLTGDDLAVAFEPTVLHERYAGVRPVGTGVGLALAAGLVARLGGEIAAGRSPEGGALFTVTLPLGS